MIGSYTSVVMTRQDAVGLMVTSPVIRPTSWNSSYISRYFWLDRALMGLVKITLCFSLNANAIAYLPDGDPGGYMVGDRRFSDSRLHV